MYCVYKYRIDDETSNKVMSLASSNSKKNKIDDLIKDLTDYDKVFDQESNIDMEEVKYERMQDVKIDDEAVAKEAENELYDYRKQSIDDINESTEAKIKQLENDKEVVKANYNESMDNTKSYYKEAKEDASQDSLRRGLSRSSIVINMLDAFDKAELARYNELNDNLTASINDIDTSISSLKTQQSEALRDFDIEYAVKLQDKINEKTKELEEKQQEVLKYNNQIAEKENEYNEKYAEMLKELKESNWDKEKDLMDYAGKYGVNMITKYKETQKYNIATEYLDAMTKEDALYQLNNNAELIELLGESNVAKLLEKYAK